MVRNPSTTRIVIELIVWVIGFSYAFNVYLGDTTIHSYFGFKTTLSLLMLICAGILMLNCAINLLFPFTRNWKLLGVPTFRSVLLTQLAFWAWIVYVIISSGQQDKLLKLLGL